MSASATGITGIDFTTDFGKRALKRLETEQIVWLTTVNANGQPLPSPLWFLWQDDAVLIYSQPKAPKVLAISHNSNVTLSFNATEHGGNVVVFRGIAEVVEPSPPASGNEAYIAKYREGLKSYGATPEEFAADYAQLIRVELTGLRGY
jgi:PPOX class probable F420-dependent enzyme